MSAAAVAALFLALTLAGWQLSRKLEQQQLEKRFHERVTGIAWQLLSRLATHEQILRSVAGFIDASEKVTPAEWRAFIRAQRLETRYPGLQAVGYATHVATAALPAHVAGMQAAGISDYRIWPDSNSNSRAPVVFQEPLPGRPAQTLGHDLQTDPVVHAAMVQASSSGTTALSGKSALTAISGTGSPAGLLMVVPHYLPPRSAGGTDGQNAPLAGYVYGRIATEVLLQNTPGMDAGELALEIIDAGAPLYAADAAAQAKTAAAPMFSHTRELTQHGRTWQLRASSLPGFEQQLDRQTPLLVLGGGLLLTILATVAAYALAISRERSTALGLANLELATAMGRQQLASSALSRARLDTQRILESITDAFYTLDERWRFTYLNPKAEELLKRRSAELLHKNIWDEFPEAVDTEIYRQYHVALGEQKTTHFVEHYAPLQTWFDIHVYPHASGISVFFRDINRRVQRDEALRLRERAIESSVNAILITDYQQIDHPVIYANPAFERITGYTATEVMGQNCRFLQGNDRDQPELKKLRALIHEGSEGRVVLRNYRKSGELFWNELYIAPVRDEQGQITHFVGVLNDITENRNYQNELERRATHDLLTGLANRGLLMDRLQLAAIQAKRRGQKVAVLFIDLDGFKMINDGFGHATGDQVLKLTGNRLAANVREGDTVGRLGGDEFVVVLNDQERIEDISEAVTRIMESVLRPIPIQSHEVALTCSIGISVCPDDGEEAGILLKYADIAMYKAKEEGKNASRFYTRGMNDTIVQRITLTNNLRRALERREFLLHYQPQLDLASGAVLGSEALIRWQHPEFGLVSPAQFIPLAEESGQIVPVGEWVLRAACSQHRAFDAAGLPPLLMSVNLSARQLRDKNLIPLIRDALQESGLPAQRLELEITESMVMADVESSLAILRQIKALGIGLAMDDFGTGYSSLSYLKRFPIDRLKIDKSFVRDITIDANDAALTTAIITLAHTLGIKVIAEGVETAEQRDFLIRAGCDQAQGYLYSRPVDAQEFPRVAASLARPRTG